MKAKTNHVWRFVSRPKGLLKESDFKWSSETTSDLGDGEILIRHIYLSLDPASRHFAREEETFVPPVELGEVMPGIGIGVVQESRNEAFQSRDMVQGFLGWPTVSLSIGSK